MAKDFDPYHKWLGIAPEERLPTYYRLLGLNLFESDPDVIEAAADRQMTYLQEVSEGSEVAQAQKLLTEVAEARLCLLNQEKKSVYDARLREQLEAIEGGQRLRSQSQSVKQKSKSKVEKASSEPTLTARKKKQARASSPSQLAKARKAKTAQQTDSVSTAPSKPERSDKRPLFIAGAVLGLILITLVAFFMISGGESPPQTDIDARGAPQVAASDKQPPPVEIPPLGSGRKVVVQAESSKKNTPTESIQREKESTGTKPTLEEPEEENEKAAENAKDDKSPDEKSPLDPLEEEAQLKKNDSLELVELEVQKKDKTSTVIVYQKNGDFYVPTGDSSARSCRLKINVPKGPLLGLCLEFDVVQTHPVTLAGFDVTAPRNVTWASADDSLGQGDAKALIDDGTDWKMHFNGEDLIWAVFLAEKPFGDSSLRKLEVALHHGEKSGRPSRFRLWGITGSGTLEEIAERMRDRELAKKPFADFVAHGLPEGGTGEVGLGSVFLGKEQLAAQLFGGSSASAGVTFTLAPVPDEAEDTLQRWEFLLRAGDKQTPVAELTQQEGKLAPLALSWLPVAAQLPEAAVLRNGLLQLRIGEHMRNIPLREVVELVPLSYNPFKTVRPQIQVPAGVAAEDLRLALQFPRKLFGVNQPPVLQVGGEQAEGEVTIKDGMVLKLAATWKEPIITLSVKTLMHQETEGKAGKQKTKTVPFKKALSELPKLATRIKKGEELLEIVQGVEKYAGRSRLKAEEKREIMMINKRWRDFGLNPRIILNEKQAEKLVKIVNVEIEKIKNRALKLKDLQDWSKQFGRDGVGAIEFRVYTLIDGVPLDLVRSTGWQN